MQLHFSLGASRAIVLLKKKRCHFLNQYLFACRYVYETSVFDAPFPLTHHHMFDV